MSEMAEREMMDALKQTYIHYGMNAFIPEIFVPIQNLPMRNKPQGGLWASRIDAEFGWRDWCKETGFCLEHLNRSFEFTISDDANKIEIHSVLDLQKLPQQKKPNRMFENWFMPDFESLLAQKCDAIELFLSDDHELYFKLYGWDCDCILVMNPNVIEKAAISYR